MVSSTAPDKVRDSILICRLYLRTLGGDGTRGEGTHHERCQYVCKQSHVIPHLSRVAQFLKDGPGLTLLPPALSGLCDVLETADRTD
jgi:hypothetical protein